jgi:hypothetical protein
VDHLAVAAAGFQPETGIPFKYVHIFMSTGKLGSYRQSDYARAYDRHSYFRHQSAASTIIVPLSFIIKLQ